MTDLVINLIVTNLIIEHYTKCKKKGPYCLILNINEANKVNLMECLLYSLLF